MVRNLDITPLTLLQGPCNPAIYDAQTYDAQCTANSYSNVSSKESSQRSRHYAFTPWNINSYSNISSKESNQRSRHCVFTPWFVNSLVHTQYYCR